MKKFLLPVFAAVMALTFTSCGNEDTATGVEVENTFTDKAKISGVAYVNITQDGTTLAQYAPEGTVLVFTAKYADLGVKNAQGNYVISTTVAANGTYAVDFPTRRDGQAINITITASEFTIDGIFSNSTQQKLNRFSVAPITVSAIPSATYFRELKFTATAINDSAVEAGWENATYIVDVNYKNDDTDPSKNPTSPDNFDVKVIIDKNQFVPARQSDLVLTAKVNNGTLKFDVTAPTAGVRASGLAFRVEGATILGVKQTSSIDASKTVTNDYVFSLAHSGVAYGGKTVDGGKVSMVRGTKITNY